MVIEERLSESLLPTCEYVRRNPLHAVAPFETNLILMLFPDEVRGRGLYPTPENSKMGSVLSVSKMYKKSLPASVLNSKNSIRTFLPVGTVIFQVQ